MPAVERSTWPGEMNTLAPRWKVIKLTLNPLVMISESERRMGADKCVVMTVMTLLNAYNAMWHLAPACAKVNHMEMSSSLSILVGDTRESWSNAEETCSTLRRTTSEIAEELERLVSLVVFVV